MHPQPATSAQKLVLPWLLALLLLLIAPLSLAETSVDNAGNADGTVTDPTTGLVWMRCAMGMTWTGSTCTGTARTYTLSQANALIGNVTFADHSDWRLPNIRELQTIVYRMVYNPAIDSAAFPNTPSTIFWSNSPRAEGGMWGVEFGYGSFEYAGHDDFGDNAVRLVRGGQSFGSLLSITRPTGDYVDHGDGTVTHTPTNLTWKRCAQGQVWDGSSCSGTPTVYSVSQANALTGTTVFAGKNDWRLPTIEELLSLVDYSTAFPVINASILPGVTSDDQLRDYLSSSRSVENLGAVQFVDFYAGFPYRSGTFYGSVLLVRGEQSSVPKCTLRADPSPVLAGASTTLTAYCSPAATSYIWTGGTCAGTTAATCTVTPTSTTTYTVAGTNALGTGAAASATVKVSASSMQVNADGTVTDPKTGLTWMRCAMGQTWTGITCSGELSTYTFDQANALTGKVTFGGRSDWRLPNIRELQTIVDRTAYLPATDSVAFPNTPFSYTVFWSSSPHANVSGYKWYIDFRNGYADSTHWSHLSAVRLVRGGQSFGTLLDAARPTYDYIDNGDGTVTHKATRLTWKRCVEGHTWNADSTCSGNAAVMKLDQAKEAASSHVFAGYNDWRLPTIEELLSLVDYSANNPAINTSVFPQTSSCCEPNFWTNSPSPDPFSRDAVWSVYLGRDGLATMGRRYGIGATRLVRGGQPSGVLLTPVCTLSASPVVVAAGASATLTANCTPAATSYVWTNGGLDAGMGSGKVSPTQTTRYSVKGVNAAGTGDAANAAVYVCNTAPGDNYSGITFSGTPAADVVANTLGEDFMDGSAGIDTVIYQCNRSSFTVTKTTSGWTVSSQAEGQDYLGNVERLRFGDETLALDISGNAGKAYRLYQAAFNRTPDNGGLKYWIAQLDAGMSLQDVAARFIDSDEFRQLYGANPSNADFLTRLYNNVLHRDPDTGGYAWWLNQLNIGAHTQTTALLGFSESPENQAGVLGAILNGIDLLN